MGISSPAYLRRHEAAMINNLKQPNPESDTAPVMHRKRAAEAA